MLFNKEHTFYLTDAQRYAIRDVTLDSGNLYFCADGMVMGVAFEDNEIVLFTFRKDGTVVREARGLDIDGWTTDTLDIDGVWHFEAEEN